MTNSTGGALNNMTDRGMIRADAFMEKSYCHHHLDMINLVSHVLESNRPVYMPAINLCSPALLVELLCKVHFG